MEAENIAEALAWVSARTRGADAVIDERFVRDLHRRMFGQVGRWAGSFRRSDRNRGVPWFQIPDAVQTVVLDARTWVGTGMDPDEASVRFGHRLVWVQPFANGNGRHSRLTSDCLARALGRPVFTWGAGPRMKGDKGFRSAYLQALRAADRGDLAPLIAFARS